MQLIFTVPTTCSEPSVEMVTFINIFLRVHTLGRTFGYFSYLVCSSVGTV